MLDIETIFRGGMGEGCILEQGQKLEDFYQIDTTPTQMGNCLLEVGKETVMDGYFSSPVVYYGKQDKKLFFLLGSEGGDLFQTPKTYYETMLRLDENRFFRMYSRKAGRDFNFVKNKWK